MSNKINTAFYSAKQLVTKICFLFIFSAELFSQYLSPRNFVPDPDVFFEEVTVASKDFSLTNLHSIYQSTDGYIWIGTFRGLVGYNGYDYENIGREIITDRVNCIFEYDNKDIWVGANSGMFVLRNKKIVPFPQFNEFKATQVNSIFRSKDGVIWIGSMKGVYRFINNKLEKYSPLPSVGIASINQDHKGVMWVGALGNGIFLLQNDKVIKRYYLNKGLPSSAINHIMVDKNGIVWAGSKKGLFRFENYKLKVFEQSDGLDNSIINYLLEDRKSNIWVATEGGVFKYANNKFRKFSYNEGLSNDLTYCLFEDREGNLYVGAHSNVLNKQKRSRLKLYNTRHGLSSSWIWSIIEDSKGNIWVGTNGNGADKISNGKVTNYSVKNGLPGNYIRTIGEDKNGDIWLGTNLYGVIRLYDGKIRVYTMADGLAGNTIRAIYKDRKGILWIGTSLGLTKYDYKKFTTYKKKDGLAHNVVRSITEDKNGKILIGTSEGMSIFHEGKFTNYSMKDGLSDDLIFSIEVDSTNTYWIGTYNNGFNRMKDGKITQYTTKDGLINEIVYQIFIANNKELVVSCNIGIYSIKLKDLNDFADGVIKAPLRSIVYEKESGSSALECNGGNQPSGAKLKTGDIWVATLSGIAAIHPEKTEINNVLPSTLIDKVSIDNKQVEFINSVETPPATDLIKIEFSALSFTNPKKNRYKYMVEGLDKDWIDIGSQNVAYLTNLPFGRYYFKVISCNNDAVWNYTPAVLEINISPYFYQTKWFVVFVVFVLIGSVYVGYRMRINRMKIRETQLINLVNERTNNLLESEKMVMSLIDSKEKFFSIITHDMKNLFTALLFYSKELYQNFPKLTSEKSTDYIERINLSATSLFELFNNLLIWSKIQTGTLEFRSDKIDLNPVITAAYNSFIDYSKRKNVKLNNEIKDNTYVMMDRNMLLMIMNNLIFNALKLAKQDTDVKVYSEEINDGIIKVSVENTGIPIKKEELEKIFTDRSIRNISNTQNEWSTALGLLLCKELIEKNKGAFSVNSIPGKGNIISFTLNRI